MPTPADPAGSGPEIQAPARKRRGFPVLPTLMVAVALPILIGFGVWQLNRLQWKTEMLERLERNSDLPISQLKLNAPPETMLFRRVRVEIRCLAGPKERAGRNLAGQSGYSVIFPMCDVRNPGESTGLMMAVNAGWMARPGGSAAAALPAGPLTGVVVPSDVGAGLQGFGLVLETAQPPLVPSAPPGLETISNNHLSYAIQWFSFATILAVIYGLWLRRWLATNRPRA